MCSLQIIVFFSCSSKIARAHYLPARVPYNVIKLWESAKLSRFNDVQNTTLQKI